VPWLVDDLMRSGGGEGGCNFVRGDRGSSEKRRRGEKDEKRAAWWSQLQPYGRRQDASGQLWQLPGRGHSTAQHSSGPVERWWSGQRSFCSGVQREQQSTIISSACRRQRSAFMGLQTLDDAPACFLFDDPASHSQSYVHRNWSAGAKDTLNPGVYCISDLRRKTGGEGWQRQHHQHHQHRQPLIRRGLGRKTAMPVLLCIAIWRPSPVVNGTVRRRKRTLGEMIHAAADSKQSSAPLHHHHPPTQPQKVCPADYHQITTQASQVLQDQTRLGLHTGTREHRPPSITIHIPAPNPIAHRL
jgi:hypothetical protein